MSPVRARARKQLLLLLAMSTALATLLGTGGAAAGAAPAAWTAPAYVRSVGHPGHAGLYAWGAATAPDGTILIGDYWNYAVRRYSTDGVLLQTLSSRGLADGQNSAPHGIAVDPVDGSVYIADMNHPTRRIIKLRADGSFDRNINTYVFGVTVPYAYVTHITVGPDGDLYAVSSHNVPYLFASVLVFSPDGTFKRAITGVGTAPGQLGLIHGIAVDAASNVYLADATKGVVQVFDATGTFVRTIGARGKGPGRFVGDMRGLAVDDVNGWLYASDSAASQIEKFTLDGTYVATLGSEGTGPGQFRDGGRELAVGKDGTLYAPDFGNYRVLTFAPSGAFVGAVPAVAPPPPPGGFNQAQGLAVNKATGAVFVADTYNHRIQQFDAAGEFVRTWGYRGSTGPVALNYPRGVAVDPARGDVWIANSRQGNVKRYSATGVYRSAFGSWGTGTGQYQLARGLTITGNRIYHADSNNNRLVATTLTGTVLWSAPCGTNFIPGQGPGLQEGCTGLDVDAAGNIYAAAVSEQALYKFSPGGTLLQKYTGSNLRGPYDIAIRGSLMYVTESNANKVTVLTLGFVKQGSFGTRGSEPGQFLTPRGIDVDNACNIYVMDSVNERVQVFR